MTLTQELDAGRGLIRRASPTRNTIESAAWASILRCLNAATRNSPKIAEARRRDIETMVAVFGGDLPWASTPASQTDWRRVYRLCGRWLACGLWDVILVRLVEAGLTDDWPTRSERYGAPVFDSVGVRRRGFFHIVTLRQAAIYRERVAAKKAIVQDFPLLRIYAAAESKATFD